MSDRSACVVEVKSASKKTRKKVEQMLEAAMAPDELYRDKKKVHAYDEEIVLGTAGAVAGQLQELIEKGHEMAYLCVQDPCYEYLGWQYGHVPGVGTFEEADCDSDGNIVLTASQLDALTDEARKTGADPAEVIDKATHRAIREAFEKYGEES